MSDNLELNRRRALVTSGTKGTGEAVSVQQDHEGVIDVVSGCPLSR